MTLHELNTISRTQLREELLKCCGSSAWVEKMMTYFPADDMVELLEDAEEIWFACSPGDWKEAFAGHPKIGDLESLTKKFATTATLASVEQSGINNASEETIKALAEANSLYEEKFGYNFIVYSTGKSAGEMLGLLKQRLQNTPEEEILVATDEQNLITKMRIEKLLE